MPLQWVWFTIFKNKPKKYFTTLKVWNPQETFVEPLLALAKCTEPFSLNCQPYCLDLVCSNQKILVMLCYPNLHGHKVSIKDTSNKLCYWISYYSFLTNSSHFLLFALKKNQMGTLASETFLLFAFSKWLGRLCCLLLIGIILWIWSKVTRKKNVRCTKTEFGDPAELRKEKYLNCWGGL